MPSDDAVAQPVRGRPEPGHRQTTQVRLHHGGWLEGALEDGIAVYRGVRYAQAPFGKLRFQAPEAVPAWAGVMPAFEFAAASPQAPREGGESMFGGEDCLALNVWAPANADAACPVMVWIPGGAYMRGNAGDPIYDGAAFGRQGIVFVSVNYRVGIDGFMAIPGMPANRGLLDQIAALRWVQENIRDFGGDAARVTLAGGSAGAGAIACLIGMPRTQGLFSKAILQSPSLSAHTADDAQVAAAAIAALLGVPLTGEAIAQVPLPTAVAAVKRLADDAQLRRVCGLSGRHFFPLRAVIDGSLVQHPPRVAMGLAWRDRPADFSLMVGCNQEEMRLYAVPGGAIDQTTHDDVLAFAHDVGVTGAAVRLYGEPVGESSAAGSQPTPGDILCAMQSDYFYRISARKIASDANAAGVRAYLYEFGWRSARCDGRLGAAHGLEIPFVFDRLARPEGREITGPGAPQTLAQSMHGAWVRFVKQGEPGWQAHTSRHAELMHFSDPCRCGPDDRKPLPALWQVAP